MGIIFPLSWPGRIVLIFIAIVLGLIFWMMMKPDTWKKFYDKVKAKKEQTKEPPIEKK